MNNQKLKLPFAAITVLCWFLFTVYLIGSMIIKINDMGIPMDFLFENYGINWIPSIVSLLLLTLVLFSRTRSFMLPLASQRRGDEKAASGGAGPFLRFQMRMPLRVLSREIMSSLLMCSMPGRG